MWARGLLIVRLDWTIARFGLVLMTVSGVRILRLVLPVLAVMVGRARR